MTKGVLVGWEKGTLVYSNSLAHVKPLFLKHSSVIQGKRVLALTVSNLGGLGFNVGSFYIGLTSKLSIPVRDNGFKPQSWIGVESGHFYPL